MRFCVSFDHKLNGTPVFYFRQVPLINEGKIVEIVEVPICLRLIATCNSSMLHQVVCRCLDDEVVEVREKAATYAPFLRAASR